MENRRNRRLWLYLISGLPVILIIGFYLWAESPPQPMPEALRALDPVAVVSVIETDDGWWEFTPNDRTPNQGFILYPGGRVDERSYAPLARDIAVNGYLVIVPDMPLNLAVLGSNIADEIIAAYPHITHWGLGGHSLGGAMAASYVTNNPGRIDALILWAATPPENLSLQETEIPITLIYGTRDGLVTPAEILASQDLFPTGTQFISIEGGNHAQFGWYGEQNGDNSPGVTRQVQSTEIIAATVQTLQLMSDNN